MDQRVVYLNFEGTSSTDFAFHLGIWTEFSYDLREFLALRFKIANITIFNIMCEIRLKRLVAIS